MGVLDWKIWDRLEALDRRVGIKAVRHQPTPEEVRRTEHVAVAGLVIGSAMGIVVGWGSGDWARSLIVIVPIWMSFGQLALRARSSRSEHRSD